MRLGVFTVLFADRPLEAALDRVVEAGLDCVEIGTGNYPGDAHCRPADLLADPVALERFGTAVTGRGLEISALSCHGNPLHPQRDVARAAHETFVRTVELADRLGVTRVNLFSGCPGDSDTATYPNWVTCAWPNEYGELLEWQWTEKVIPYWREQAAFARRTASGSASRCTRASSSTTRARSSGSARPAARRSAPTSTRATCSGRGSTSRPAIAELGRAGAIFHTHAKDTAIHPRNAALNGVLDTVPLAEVGRRSWIFRTVGYGHGELDWRRILTALRLAGYDDVLSIEHEDALLSIDEGFRKGVAFLRSVMPIEPALSDAWWT